MPELPEVETVRRGLRERLRDRSFEGISYLEWPRTLEYPDAGLFNQLVAGRRVVGVRRRAKFILLDLSGDFCLSIHLRMTGQVLVEPASAPRGRFARVAFVLDGGAELRFDDARRFGRVGLYQPDELSARLARLGPEPLGEDLDVATFATMLRRRHARLKPLLLDQSFLAGLGNIYVDEALHRAGLHPLLAASALSPAEAGRLYYQLRELLTEAIASGGTTFSSYRDAFGNAGDYFERRRVYAREGEPCTSCGLAIARITVGGRGTHFCPSCQALPGAGAIVALPVRSPRREVADEPGVYEGNRVNQGRRASTHRERKEWE